MKWTPADPAFQKVPELVGGVDHDPPLPAPVTATVIEDYESFDAGDYSVGSPDGSMSYSTTTNNVQQGTYAAVLERDSTGGGGYAISTAGLPNYPSRGDDVWTWVRFMDSDSRGGVNIAADGTTYHRRPVGWEAEFGPYLGGARIMKVQSGSKTEVAKVNQSFSADTDYQVRINHKADDTIEMEVYDAEGISIAGPISTVDSYHPGDGVGITVISGQAGSRAQAQFDNMRVP